MPKRFRFWSGDLPLIEFAVGGVEYKINPNLELGIEETMVGAELARQPAKAAWVGVLCSMADRLEGKREYEMDVCRAKLDREVRSGAAKKLTEAAVKAAILRHPTYAEAVETHLKAKELAGQLKALVQAFRERGFDLRELSARQRGEERGSHG